MAQSRGSFSGTVDADGALSVKFGPGARTLTWTVRQVSVEMSAAPAGSTCSLRESGRLITPMVPTGDTAAGDPSIELRGGDQLEVAWTGGTEGDTGYVYVIYDETRALS